MKTLLSLYGGAIVLTEQAGAITLTITAQAGGGEAAGIVKGSGSVVLNGAEALQLAEVMLNKLLPAAVQPLATVIEGVVNQAIQAIE